MSAESSSKLIISGPDLSLTHEITQPTTIMGRQSTNDIHLPSSMVSRKHAEIRQTNQGYTLTDLGSSNGTVLNGNPLDPNTPTLLKDNDTLEIGPFQISYQQLADVNIVNLNPQEISLPQSDPQKEPQPEQPQKPINTSASGSGQKPPQPPSLRPLPSPNGMPPIPPGLELDSYKLINYIPPIYHSPFMSRFLAMFESILLPIEWTADHFDLFLNPKEAPSGFLPWLAGWWDMVFDDTWTDQQRRTLLIEAHEIFARRGTKWALSRVLEIYTGRQPLIDDTNTNLPASTFNVRIPLSEQALQRELVENIIDAHKPAHTTYNLSFSS